MKRLIKITNNRGRYIEGVMQYDNGSTMKVTMERNDYESQLEREKLHDFLSGKNLTEEEINVVMGHIDEIEHIGYCRGSDEGYCSGWEARGD